MFMYKMENDRSTKLHERRRDDGETNFFIDENDMGL